MSSPFNIQYLLKIISSTVLLLASSLISSAQKDNEIEVIKKELRNSISLIQSLQSALEKSNQHIIELTERVNRLENKSIQNIQTSDEISPKTKTQIDSIQEQVDYLEEHIVTIDEHVGSQTIVRAFDAMNLNIGGFMTQSITGVIGEDNSELSFNQTFFELLISADINEDWSLFTALGFLRESDLNFFGENNAVKNTRHPFFENFATRVPPIIAWANYRHTDSLQLQFGRFITPHGIINVEHFPPVLLEVSQPQFLRPFPGASIFPNFLNGGHIHGNKFFDKNELQYSMYAGSFVGNDAEDLITGGRLGYNFTESGLKLGFNYSHGRRTKSRATITNFSPETNSIVPTKSLTSNSYDTVGIDVLYENEKVIWKNEVFKSFEYSEDDRLGFYTQPGLKLSDKWIAFYRYDYFDPGQHLEKSTEHVLGFNFLPIPTIRLRGAYFLKEFDHPDIESQIFQFSATVSF